jgi:hypothetical protein
MPESENRSPQSVFDAEAEFPHDDTRSGRRRRPVADWGGDELFTRMPRRRSGHAVGQRRFARDAVESPLGGSPERGEWLDDDAPERAEWLDDEAPERDDWLDDEASARHDWSDLESLDESAAREPQRTGPEPRRTRPEPPTAPPEPPTAGNAPDRPASTRSTGGVPGRRTVVIGRSGRPEAPPPEAPFVSVSRRRPPRTLAERIGGQPDRIVGWAFALGLILILVAILTAHA